MIRRVIIPSDPYAVNIGTVTIIKKTLS